MRAAGEREPERVRDRVSEHGKLANLVAVGSLFKAPFKNALCQRPHASKGERESEREGGKGSCLGLR